MDLNLGGHMQFGRLQRHHIIQRTEDQDGYNNGKISYQCATLETNTRGHPNKHNTTQHTSWIQTEGAFKNVKANIKRIIPADLCREISAGFELLEWDGHGVSAEEQDERQERQIRNIFTGFAHQNPAELHAVFLIQLTPVHSREIKLLRNRQYKCILFVSFIQRSCHAFFQFI